MSSLLKTLLPSLCLTIGLPLVILGGAVQAQTTPGKPAPSTPSPATSPKPQPAASPAPEGLDPVTQQALDQFNQGNFDAALGTLQKVLDQAKTANNWQKVGEALNNIGLVQEQKQQSDGALKSYQAALDAYDTLAKSGGAANVRDSKVGEAKTLNNIGGVYLNLKQPETAVGFLERSLVLLREVQLPNEEAATLRNLAGIYLALQRVPDALQSLQNALTVETRSNNVPGQLITREQLANLYSQVGQFPEALKVLQEGLTIAQTLKNEDLIAVLQSQIGEVQEYSGNEDGAKTAYEASLAIVQKSTQPNTKAAMADLLSRLGAIEGRLGQLQPAIDRYQQALAQISQSETPLLWGQTMLALGQLYTAQQNWTAAQDTYTKALAGVEPLKVPLAQAQLLRGLATVYQAQKNLPQALTTAQQALTLEQSLKDQTGNTAQAQQQEIGNTLTLLGDLYRQQKQYDQALNQYQAAYTAFTTAQDAYGQGGSLRDLGVTQLLHNTPQEAVKPLLAAVQLWQLLSYQTGRVLDPTLEAHQLLQVALIRSKQADLALASAEDERSFPFRVQQVWQSQGKVKPTEPLNLEQIRAIVTKKNQPFIFYDLATEPGETEAESIPKLRIWIIPPSGDITLHELALSSVGIKTPEDFLALINNPKGQTPETLKQLSALLVTPIALELNALSSPNVHLVIPPIFQSVPFGDLALPGSDGSTKPLKDRFQFTLSPSIFSLSQSPAP